MTFVDTGAWYALFTPTDPDHAAAIAWLQGNSDALLTTDYVVDETLTLLRVRGQNAQAVRFGERIFGGDLAALQYLTEGDIEQAWLTFRQFSDKGWSFTDCTSRATMRRLGIVSAFAFDQHFRQFGGVTSSPERHRGSPSPLTAGSTC